MLTDGHERSRITLQERKVVGLIVSGNTNKEIAAALRISPFTVKRHVENVLRKLQLRNRVEIAVYGARLRSLKRKYVLNPPTGRTVER